VLAACFLIACSDDRDARVAIPLPRLPAGPLELRVLYLVNERLPQPTHEALQALLDSGREATRAHFGREVRFTSIDVRPIEFYFSKFPEPAKAAAAEWIYDFKKGTGNMRRLREGFGKDLRKTGDDLDAMIGYARPYLLEAVREKSFDALAEALISTQLARLGQLATASAPDGRPLIDERPYNEYVYWDFMSYAPLPYEIILTNQLIASVEYSGNSVHSALRGGVTNGITVGNPLSRFGATAIVSTYPMFGTDPVTMALRAHETYSPPGSARYAGVVLAHELGHTLWHLGHPYGNSACVMNPTPLLHFRRWVEGLAPTRCPIGGEEAMKPGYTKMYTAGTQ